MSGKHKWPRPFALEVARDVLKWLTPHCERIVIAGSLRRGKAEVGDIEFLFIPRMVQQPDPEQLFVTMQTISAVDLVIEGQVQAGELTRRPKSDGSFTWGSDIKLAIHECSGMPLDFFSASPQTWWCNLVCRTGPAQHNIALASAARDRGYKWLIHPGQFSKVALRGDQYRLAPAPKAQLHDPAGDQFLAARQIPFQDALHRGVCDFPPVCHEAAS